jgi:hypothetical protein
MFGSGSESIRAFKQAWEYPKSIDRSPIILDQADSGRACPSARAVWNLTVLDQCIQLPGDISTRALVLDHLRLAVMWQQVQEAWRCTKLRSAVQDRWDHRVVGMRSNSDQLQISALAISHCLARVSSHLRPLPVLGFN